MGHPIYKDPEVKPAPKNTLNSFIDEALARKIAGKPVAGKAKWNRRRTCSVAEAPGAPF